KIDENRERSSPFNDKSPQSVADALGSHFCENLVQAVKNRGANCIKIPSRHIVSFLLLLKLEHSAGELQRTATRPIGSERSPAATSRHIIWSYPIERFQDKSE